MDKGLTELEKRVKDDPEVFSRLYRLNYRRIFNYALYSTGDIEISLDLTSETFFKAIRAVDRFDHRKGTFTAWLYAIASREVQMHYRRLGNIVKHVAVRRSFAGKAEEIRRSIPTEEMEDARRELERCEDLAMLAPMFRRLSPRYREVLYLRFFEDRSLDEIAGILGRPVGTVKAQCHRGLRILRKMMQPFEGLEHMEEQKVETEKEMESSLKGAGESGT